MSIYRYVVVPVNHLTCLSDIKYFPLKAIFLVVQKMSNYVFSI